MQIQKFRVRGVVALSIVLFVIAVFSHYPITMLNAVTEAQVPGFSFHLSVWRILFELLPGILLFFHQSFFTIKEFPLLVWILSKMPGISCLLMNQTVEDFTRMHPEYDRLQVKAGGVLLVGSGTVARYRMKCEKLIV